MHVFFVWFLVYSAKVIVRGDDESKYIDLLPEKEKQEFLEKIARRILEEVETRDEKPIGSREIPAELLNKQEEFVRTLLTEESKKERKKIHDTGTNLDVNTTISSMRAALRDEREDQRQSIVDLTLRADGSRRKRENKRRVYTGYAPDSDNSTEDRKENTPQESDIDIQVKNFRRGITDHVTADGEENNITINYATHTTEENMAIVRDQSNEYNITDPHHFNSKDKQENKVSIKEILYSTDRSELEKVTINFDKFYETESTSHGNSKYVTGNKSSSAETDASKSAKNESVIKPTDLSINTNQNKNNRANEKEINKTINGHSTSDKMLNMESTKILRTSFKENILSNYAHDDLKQIESAVTEIKENKDSDIIKIEIATVQPTNTTTINDDVNDKEDNNLRYEKYENTTPMTELFTPVSIDATNGSIRNTQKNDLGTANTESDSLKTADDSKTFLDKEVKSLRQDIVINDNKNEELKHLTIKPQEYRVYEIASDDLPFTKQDLPQQIQKQKQSSVKKTTQTDSFFSSLQTRKPLQLNSKQLEFLKQLIASNKPNEQRIHEKRLKKQPKSNLKGSLGNREPETTISEEPYYAPIYNYVPSNAFYNPLIVFGPNLSDKDDNSESIKEKGYNLEYTFTSNKPNNDKNKKQKENFETNNQPFHVPIYYYSPKNAFFNSYNKFGPNADNNDPEAEVKHLDYDNDLYDDDDDNYKEIKERNQIEWQYLHEPLKNNTNAYNVKPNYKKAENDASVSDNLIEAVKNLILKQENKRYKYEINIIPKSINEILGNDLDWTSKKEKEYLRCSYKNRCGTYVSEEKKSKEKGTESDELDLDTQFLSTTMSKVRHMLLESGHFMLAHAENTSKLDLLFDSAENAKDVKAESHKGDERKKSLRITIQPDEHKLKKEETFHTSNENIAIDYYERVKDYKSSTDTKEKDNFSLKTNEQDLLKQISNNLKTAIDDREFQEINLKIDKFKPLKLLYIKHSEDVTNKPNIRTERSKKKKSDREVEFKFVTDLAKTMREPSIIKLYLQMKSIMREGRQGDQNLDIFVEVLDNMIKENNIGVVGYDWLGTAVDLQSALKKLMTMIEAVQAEDDAAIHPSDLELLKYVVYLHRIARDVVDKRASSNQLRGMKIHGGHKRHRASNIIKESGLLYRAWLIRLRPQPIADEDLVGLRGLLHRLQDHLTSLHTVIKHIAMNTKYVDQRWFEKLKQNHFDHSKRRLLEVILHLALTRLFGLIEESSKNGLEDDFAIYAENNEGEVERTKEEFVFVLNILDSLDLY